MGEESCGYDCCNLTESWPEYIEKKSAFEKKENLGVVRIGLPHAKEEFLKDIKYGTPELFIESFQRSYIRPWEPKKRKKFEENNGGQSVRYFFDPELKLVFVVAWLGFRFKEEFVSGKIMKYRWMLKTVYFDSNFFKIKKYNSILRTSGD